MKTIEKIVISFNVFALYFAYNSFLGNSDTENRNYNFSLSIFVIVNGLIAFSFIRDFTFSKIVYLIISAYPILISVIFERKIKESYAKFTELGFRKYYFVFIIYLFAGFAGVINLFLQ